jgi:hypothetical protein
MHNSQKGISEIIGSLMILLIISALGTILYNYSINVMNYQQNILQTNIKIASEKAQERIRVISSNWIDSGNMLNLTILNYGVNSIKIDDVYLDQVRVQLFLLGKGEVIHTSNLGSISFVSPIPIQLGNIYEVVIVSERGVSHTLHFES